MPKLIRLYIRQVILGFVISAGFVAMILWFNVANLWHLVTHDPAGPLAVGLLWLFNGIVFSGVQFGISIMRLAEDEDDTGGPARRRRWNTPPFPPAPTRGRAAASDAAGTDRKRAAPGAPARPFCVTGPPRPSGYLIPEDLCVQVGAGVPGPGPGQSQLPRSCVRPAECNR